ncbi:hypothetical protein LINPERHAP1_LOCUS17666 [Linum perenne]
MDVGLGFVKEVNPAQPNLGRQASNFGKEWMLLLLGLQDILVLVGFFE